MNGIHLFTSELPNGSRAYVNQMLKMFVLVTCLNIIENMFRGHNTLDPIHMWALCIFQHEKKSDRVKNEWNNDLAMKHSVDGIHSSFYTCYKLFALKTQHIPFSLDMVFSLFSFCLDWLLIKNERNTGGQR